MRSMEHERARTRLAIAFGDIATWWGTADETVRNRRGDTRPRRCARSCDASERRRPRAGHGNAADAHRAGAADERPRRCARIALRRRLRRAHALARAALHDVLH